MVTSDFSVLKQRPHIAPLTEVKVVTSEEDKEIPVYEIPLEYRDIRPLAYKQGTIPKGFSTRGYRLYVNDLIAVLGPSKEDPFWILKITKLRTKTLDFQWYDKDGRDRYTLQKEVQTEKHHWATYLHWRFKLCEDKTIRASAIKSIAMHRQSWPSIPKKQGKKRKRNQALSNK